MSQETNVLRKLISCISVLNSVRCYQLKYLYIWFHSLPPHYIVILLSNINVYVYVYGLCLCFFYVFFYVGQTRRHIHTRISEDMGVSPLTGKERSISTMSSILAHKHMHKHPVSASDFKILSSGTSEWDLLIRESLLISQLNPVLNANIRSTPPELF